MFQVPLTIARNTFTESIRQPIFAVLILVGALALVLNPQLAAYSMETGGGDNKMLIDLSLSSIFIVSLVLAAFTATGVLSSEVENRTVLTVVSKPVPRPSFVIGKFLGVAGAIAISYYILCVLFALTVRHRVMSTASDELDGPVILFGLVAGIVALVLAAWGNYFYNWVFSSTFVVTLAITITVAMGLVLLINKHWEFQSPVTDFQERGGELTQIVAGLWMVFWAVMILTAVAIAASTRLGQVMTLLVCIAVFLIGLLTNSLSTWVNMKIGVPQHMSVWDSVAAVVNSTEPLHLKLVYLLLKLGYVVAPNLQFLWPADAITQGNSLIHNEVEELSFNHLGSVTAYAVLYTIVVISAAVALFQTREVG